MNERMGMAMIFPLLAVLLIAGFAGGLGVIFMVVESTAAEAWGVVGLGMAVLIGVPAAAAIIQWRVEKE